MIQEQNLYVQKYERYPRSITNTSKSNKVLLTKKCYNSYKINDYSFLYSFV